MEEKLNLLDKIIIKVTEWLSNPKTSFAFGLVVGTGFFYLLVHIPVINNYTNMIAASHKDIDFWKAKSENDYKNYQKRILEVEEREKRIQDEALLNIMKTNQMLKDLRSDKYSEAELSKKIADYQNQILK